MGEEGGEKRNTLMMNNVCSEMLEYAAHLIAKQIPACFSGAYTTTGFLISFFPMKVPVIAIFPFLFQGPLMIPWLASEGKVISGEMSSSEEKEIAGLPAWLETLSHIAS